VQVHGGMGFIDETGAAQYYRDARILPIYEGTTAIQANDLIGRKTVRDGGVTAKAILAEVRATAAQLAAADEASLQAIGRQLALGADALEDVVNYVTGNIKADIKAVFAGSVPYLKQAGVVLGGWQMGRAALAAARRLQEGQGDARFYEAKIATARFFTEHILPLAMAYRTEIVEGAGSVLALQEDQF
jgi:butyryl-CoA dehydrogenase